MDLIFCRLLNYQYPLETATRSKLVRKTCFFNKNLLLQLFKYIYLYIYNKKVVYLCVTPHWTIQKDSSDISTKKSYILLKQGYWMPKSFTIMIYLKIESYIQLARQKSTNRKSQMSKNVKLIMKYNPRLSDLNSLLKKHMPLLYTDPTLKTVFPQGCIIQYLKEISH